ncbi:MAG: sodium:proton antiporter [Gammaproteobacteria bacterium]|nr:MAG: sodium:proton antiporter [Gammaproteobacteria bacterium]
MSISIVLMLLAMMLLLALLLKPLAEKYHIPFAGLLVLTGFIGSEVIVGLGGDTGLRYDSFHELIIFVFLPLLIFEAAFKIEVESLFKNLLVILFFAIPVLLLSTVIAAVMIYYGIGHPTGFPWIAALLTGSLLAATDPVAVLDIMRKAGVSERLCLLIEGEALFNDATAIVTFSIFLYIAQHPLEDIAVWDASLRFLVVFFGGSIVGLVIGFFFLFLSRLLQDFAQQAIVTLIAAYISFLTAEQWLNVSGVMSVLVTGVILGQVIHHDFQDHEKNHFVDDFWTVNVYVAEALMFLLMGVTITVGMFIDNWLAMLIGIVSVLIARAVGVFAGAPLISFIPKVDNISMKDQQLMFVGGLRGAVVLALALSLPLELEYWWTVQSIAFGVVLFTLFIQAPLIMPLLKYQAAKEKETDPD